MKINDIMMILDSLFPQEQASDFDFQKIGFTIGSKNDALQHILLSLDLTLEVVEEAISLGANLIVTHHPFFFEPLTQIDLDSNKGKIIEKMISNRISLFAIHTNLDVATDGVNDTLAIKLGLENRIGLNQKDQFLRVGVLPQQSLDQLVKHVKEVFALDSVRVAGNLNKMMKTIGIIGGSGGQIEEIDQAIATGCDCFITGEIKLHIAQYAVEQGLTLIEVPHGVEKFVFENVQISLQSRLEPKYHVYISKINTDPLNFI